MENLYLKLHSSCISWVDNHANKPQTIQPTIEELALLLERLKPITIHCERPFTTPSANPKIYYIFTLLGALKALAYTNGAHLKLHNISEVREDLFGASYLTKDFVLNQTNTMWRTAHTPDTLPVHEMCMFDCWCLAKRYFV